MSLPSTLTIYLARLYSLNLLFMTAGLWGFVYLFDTIELLRRAGKRESVPLGTVLEMGLLKLPEVGQILLPFAVLFAALLTFWQLARRQEFTAARAAGLSVWQFLAPVIAVAVLAGILQPTILNPASAVLLRRFEVLETKYLSSRTNRVSLSNEGLWLRQIEEGSGTYTILHAKKIQMPGWNLRGVMALSFDAHDNPVQRVDTKTARLEDGLWHFENALVNYLLPRPEGQTETLPVLSLTTDLTTSEIEESFADPETISFWALPDFIQTMEVTGFDAAGLRIHFHTLLAQPLLFAAMVLLAAVTGLRPPRMGGAGLFAALGVAGGFGIFFLGSFLQALGTAHRMPVLLSAWSAPLLAFILAMWLILHSEDG